MCSGQLQRQPPISPFHPLLTKLPATCKLLWNTCHRKNLILRGSLHFQSTPATSPGHPLLVKNGYKDLVEKKIFFGSSAQKTSSG